MIDVEISDNAIKKATKYQVKNNLYKQVEFLEYNPRHNSLKFENFKEIPGVWKFRVGKHYWGLVIRPETNKMRVYDVIKHP